MEEQAQRVSELKMACSDANAATKSRKSVRLSGFSLSGLDDDRQPSSSGAAASGKSAQKQSGAAAPGPGLEQAVVQLQLRLSSMEDRVEALERENRRLSGALSAAAAASPGAAAAIVGALGGRVE